MKSLQKLHLLRSNYFHISRNMEKEVISQLASLAHERRLAVFRVLMRRFPDALPAGELTQVLNVPASSLSACLSHLRQAGLVSQTRSGTSLLYAAKPQAAAQLVDYLASDCCRGRPETCLPVQQAKPEPAERKYTVLFICSGNSARSIFAETLMREVVGDIFDPYSAGTAPHSDLNPFAVDLLAAKGHDISGLRAKNITEFQGDDAPKMDFVVTVCDRAANEECPPWPGQPMTGHWGQPDPVKATGTDAEKRLAFQQVYGALRNRIHAFAALPIETLDRVSLQNKIDDIAKMKD